MTEATIDTDLIPADLHVCLDDLARHLATGAALRGKGLRWISRADQATPEGGDPQGALALAIAHSPPDQPDANAPTGTLFAIFDAAATAEDSFLRPARQMRAAGYVMHGPRCLMVLTCGDGVQVQALDGWAFAIERARATLPDTVRDLAIDMSQYRHWPRPVRAYVDDCLAGVQGPRGRTIDLRWTPSLVAEAHRILMRGGIYLAPADARSGHARGSLSMLHQAAPIAFLIEQAGGRATDGALPILDAVITGFDSRTPLVFGCVDKVDRVAAYHDLPEAEVSALFGHRGLFRT